MIENILDLSAKTVNIDKLEKLDLVHLLLIRDEIQAISNTPPCLITESYSRNKYLNEKVTGLDSLWSYVNIAITEKKLSLSQRG